MLFWVAQMQVRLVIRSLGGSVRCTCDWWSGGCRFDPLWVGNKIMEIDDEIFSTVIFSLPLIQEGQLSVSGKRMCTILVNHLHLTKWHMQTVQTLVRLLLFAIPLNILRNKCIKRMHGIKCSKFKKQVDQSLQRLPQNILRNKCT